MSLVVLGLFAWQLQSLSGAVFLLLAHGLGVAGLFAVVGAIGDRGRSTGLDAMGGWYRPMPRLGVLLLLLVLTGVGLPGLANFVGEFLVLAGSVQASLLWGGVATAGIVVSVVYFLRMYERSMLGPLREETTLKDLGVRETLALGTLVALILWLGLYPASFLAPIESSVAAITEIRPVSPGVVADHVPQ